MTVKTAVKRDGRMDITPDTIVADVGDSAPDEAQAEYFCRLGGCITTV